VNDKRRFRKQVIAIVCIGLILPQAVMAAPAAANRQITDVALANGGMLSGQVVDQQGLGKAGVQVVVLQQGRQPAYGRTDHAGNFQVAGLSGGTAQVVTEGGQGVYRLWTANAAPPVAKPRAMLIANGQVVRGQAYCDPCSSGGIGQWILPALAAGGIIAGVVVATSDSGSTPASP
jgi:hypothetical protein